MRQVLYQLGLSPTLLFLFWEDIGSGYAAGLKLGINLPAFSS